MSAQSDPIFPFKTFPLDCEHLPDGIDVVDVATRLSLNYNITNLIPNYYINSISSDRCSAPVISSKPACVEWNVVPVQVDLTNANTGSVVRSPVKFLKSAHPATAKRMFFKAQRSNVSEILNGMLTYALVLMCMSRKRDLVFRGEKVEAVHILKGTMNNFSAPLLKTAPTGYVVSPLATTPCVPSGEKHTWLAITTDSNPLVYIDICGPQFDVWNGVENNIPLFVHSLDAHNADSTSNYEPDEIQMLGSIKAVFAGLGEISNKLIAIDGAAVNRGFDSCFYEQARLLWHLLWEKDKFCEKFGMPVFPFMPVIGSVPVQTITLSGTRRLFIEKEKEKEQVCLPAGTLRRKLTRF